MNDDFAFPLFRAISKEVRDIDGPLTEKSPTSLKERLVSRREWLLSNHSSERSIWRGRKVGEITSEVLKRMLTTAKREAKLSQT